MSSILSKLINLAGNVTGLLANTNGGTGKDSSAFTGVAKVASGTWSASTIVNADVSNSAAIAYSKLNLATAVTLGANADNEAVIQTNNTSGHAALQVVNNDSTSSSDAAYLIDMIKGSTTSSTSQKFVLFRINAGSTNSGSITANGANAATFTSTSDSRLKENISDLKSQLENILALRPVEFDFKDGSGHQIGFIAQDMQNVYPDVIGAGQDGYLEISGWDKTSARLVKAIQDLNAKFEAYKAAHP